MTTVIRLAPEPQRTIIGVFLVLAAVVAAVAPLPLSLRSALVVLLAYLAFANGGMPYAYLAALAAPALGLVAGDVDWLVMLPVVLSGNLLAMLGLEFSWRWPALLVSPALLVLPAFFVRIMAQRELFAVELPWDDGRGAWVALHLLVAVFGVLIALLIDRQRSQKTASSGPGGERGGIRGLIRGRGNASERARRVAPPKGAQRG